MASTALEDYLKIIFKLQEGLPASKGVSTTDIAARLNISKASVSNMLKKLSEQGFIDYAPYQGVALTEQGQKIALNMIRRHRIVELFLVERLGFGWDEVDEEAEILEHAISDKLANRMWQDLGCPTQDPHGSPIPDESGQMMVQNWGCLANQALDAQVTIERIQNRSPEELRYLESIGLTKGICVQVKSKAPFKGPVTLSLPNQLCSIDYRMAKSILVSETCL
ncbi:metal-dependent transcriptional regulator [Thiosulfativibrio zosterae]|uniref:Transcriptional regulator MntR n=1 Tax=Thiosulfativibrio zosterae TaxID=2675053 RepID=A0A6F8PNP3_9GAMM|nr:metal-dependent transcriptional regulator [Thiosulfativibrio zosterae]BBP43706.1 transcriptional regulator [Thiosulfativibrio zosterae]